MTPSRKSSYMISTSTRRLYKSDLRSSTSLLHQLLGSLFPKSVSIPVMCGRDTQSLKTKSAWEKASTITYQKSAPTFRLLCSKAPSKWSPLRSHVWNFINSFHTTNAALCVIWATSWFFPEVVLSWRPNPSWAIKTYKSLSCVFFFSSVSHTELVVNPNPKMIPYRLHVLGESLSETQNKPNHVGEQRDLKKKPYARSSNVRSHAVRVLWYDFANVDALDRWLRYDSNVFF